MAKSVETLIKDEGVEWKKIVGVSRLDEVCQINGNMSNAHLSVDLILALDAGGHSMVRGWCELFTRATDLDSTTFK